LRTTAKEKLINPLPFDTSIAHGTISAELEELGATFALEALPLDEREAYIGHLQVCSMCRRMTSEFQVAATLLPEAIAEERGSAGLKRRILARARLDIPEPVRSVPRPSGPKLAAPLGWPWRAWLAPVRIGAAAALALVVGLAVWNVVLQARLEDQQDLLSGQSRLLSALAAGARVSQLPGTQAAPEASATLVQVPKESRAWLLVRNLPPLRSDREYQIWRITGGVAVSAGTFPYFNVGEQLLTVTADLLSADAIGISNEPRGGSVVPKGDIVILGHP